MEISSVKFIHLYDLTRSSCEKCNFCPSGKNRACGAATPVQRFNQLSYRGQLHGMETCQYYSLFLKRTIQHSHNYQPISPLCVLSKVLERCVHNHQWRTLGGGGGGGQEGDRRGGKSGTKYHNSQALFMSKWQARNHTHIT